MRAPGRAMGKAAYGALWCFVLVLPWDVFVNLPVVGSIPRIVGLVASAGGVLYVLARRSLTPLSWFHMFAALFVLWAGVSSFWSIDPEATRTRVITYLQLVVLVWLIWEIAWSSARQRALFQAYVVGASVAALVTIHNFLSGPLGAETGIARFTALNQDANELGLTLALAQRMAVATVPPAWHDSSFPHGFPRVGPRSARGTLDHSVDPRAAAAQGQSRVVRPRCRIARGRE